MRPWDGSRESTSPARRSRGATTQTPAPRASCTWSAMGGSVAPCCASPTASPSGAGSGSWAPTSSRMTPRLETMERGLMTSTCRACSTACQPTCLSGLGPSPRTRWRSRRRGKSWPLLAASWSQTERTTTGSRAQRSSRPVRRGSRHCSRWPTWPTTGSTWTATGASRSRPTSRLRRRCRRSPSTSPTRGAWRSTASRARPTGCRCPTSRRCSTPTTRTASSAR